MSKFIFAAVAFGLILVGPAASQEGTAKPEPLMKELSKDFPKGDELEARVMTVALQPGMSSPWHTHAAPVIVY
jgi:quercetin dioxygenase-like cupin family protein